MKKELSKYKQEMMLVGHLDDIDDLKKYGRDGPLDNTRQNTKNLQEIVKQLAKRIYLRNKSAVLFITSDKVRSIQTAMFIGGRLKIVLKNNIKVRYSIDKNVKAPEQGAFILPENYRPGDFFDGLNIASEIFINESFKKNNLSYKFGDPLLQNNGSYKYPSLKKYFRESGETYSEALIRIFSSVLKLSDKMKKLDNSTEVVLVYHGFVLHILNGLSVLANKIKNEGYQLKANSLASQIWDIYNVVGNNLKLNLFAFVEIEYLNDPELIEILKNEIKILKNENKQ